MFASLISGKTYIPINKVMALTLSIKKVSGKVKVINIVVVRPGIDPTKIPSVTPKNSKKNGHKFVKYKREFIKFSISNSII